MSNKTEQKYSDDLEDAAKEYCKTIFHKPFSENPQEEHIVYDPDKYNGFIAGANWQKKQMMKGVVEGTVLPGSNGTLIDTTPYSDGDKVKVIVIKED